MNNRKVFVEICTGTGKPKLQLLTSSRPRTDAHFVAISNYNGTSDAICGNNNVEIWKYSRGVPFYSTIIVSCDDPV